MQVETDLEPDEAAAKLRQGDRPIIGRIANDTLLLDPRTVLRDPYACTGQPDATDLAMIESLKRL